MDEGGTPYFYNARTRETTWSRPEVVLNQDQKDELVRIMINAQCKFDSIYDIPPQSVIIKTVASSHGTWFHHLPRELNKRKYKYPWLSPRICNDARGGRKITFELAESTIRDMAIGSHARILVWIVGANNIRKEGKAEDIIPPVAKIVQECACLGPDRQLVVCSLLPSLRTDSDSKERFTQARTLLKNLLRQYPHNSSFLDLSNSFAIDGIVNEELYDYDGIHLCPGGAGVLAHKILDLCQRRVIQKMCKKYN